jgi:hypothetical protein
MKKNITLFVLFIVPLVAYLFFASGVNSFTKLPVLTPKINEFGSWKTIDGELVALQNKITVLGFGGLDVLKNRGNIFNLNQKIYERYHKFNDLQFVILCPEETQEDIKKVIAAMKQTTEMEQWKFVLVPKEAIKIYFESLQLKKDKLNPDFGSDKVYLVDKELNLRGRKLNNKKEYKEGYSMFHISELSNEMLDDFKIVLYEYRAALKKNNNAEKSIEKLNNAKK